MPLQIPPGFMHASYFIDGPGAAAGSVVTCGWQLDATTSFLQGQADALIDALGAAMVGQTHTTFTYRGGRLIVNSGGVLRAFDVVTSRAGTVTGEPAMMNTAVLIRKVTELFGRRHQGRMFMPGVAENHVQDGRNLPAANLTAYQNAINSWATNSTAVAGVGEPFILHSEGGVNEPPIGTTPPSLITRFAVQALLATQRRRLRA